MARATLVVPCFNEAARLDPEPFLRLVGMPGVSVLFVDDGSTDATLRVIESIRDRATDRVEVLRLDVNRGKGEAVRRGLTQALAGGTDVVGYFDADLSTSIDEMWRLVGMMRESAYSVLVGSRVRMLGTEIHRSAVRHSFGRLFATVAARVLGHHVYDTQCGAKVFRRTEMLEHALRTPFASRWTFDVELLGRLTMGTADVAPIPMREIIEVPLLHWQHAPGSKFRALAMVRGAIDLALIARRLDAFQKTRSRP